MTLDTVDPDESITSQTYNEVSTDTTLKEGNDVTNDTAVFTALRSNSSNVQGFTSISTTLFAIALSSVIILVIAIVALAVTILVIKNIKRRRYHPWLRTPLLGNETEGVSENNIQTVANVAYIPTVQGNIQDHLYSSMIYNSLYPHYRPGSNDNSNHIYASIKET